MEVLLAFHMTKEKKESRKSFLSQIWTPFIDKNNILIELNFYLWFFSIIDWNCVTFFFDCKIYEIHLHLHCWKLIFDDIENCRPSLWSIQIWVFHEENSNFVYVHLGNQYNYNCSKIYQYNITFNVAPMFHHKCWMFCNVCDFMKLARKNWIG